MDCLTLERAELQAMLDRAAQRGATEALERLGLHDDSARDDLKELRGLLESLRAVRKEVVLSFTRWLTGALIGAVLLGVWVYARTQGGSQ